MLTYKYNINYGGAKMEIYKTKEVAEILDIHITTVRNLIKTGQLEAKKVGKGYRITENQLRRYLEGDNTKSKD